ncbi:Aspartic proteinase sxa1 [Schizosaccharomyces pombe]|uniref:Aspartic proteinase sxa1 n=1 Tax=Schizosaccharomyces pombe (strain 972 / ATCC 24843) TaxID=284812 RepID=SXA1_SCHPO|nr:aspartic protease Sxa1 [Schizosaccharomyces pombe]P32834.2 RecName: Full=Aspartic proteinase sxa1; Flags: Precursor [Schizosaccharomyces pombe 972h-]CAB86349.2 aspartic protease Sxa1 [Schizosaccharomyces pombe]|eukprot:NP_001342952.1 aspartic protease Sxa1 [Schizosaccharomyces pombe]
MKASFFVFAISALQALQASVASAYSEVPGKRSVVLNLQHSQYDHVARKLERTKVLNKRDSSGYPVLDLEYTDAGGYFANLTLGSNERVYSLTLDTGSPYTWVTAKNITALSASEIWSDTDGVDAGRSTSDIRTNACTNYTCFDYSSTTARRTNSSTIGFLASYGDNTTVLGYNMVDNAYFAGLTLPGFEFGLATREYDSSQISVTPGIIGLSVAMTITGISSDDKVVAFTPPTIVDQLVSANVIDTPAFGIYLNEDVGELIFGGYDKAKINGSVHWVNISSSDDSTFYSVNLESITVTNSTSSNNVQSSKRSSKDIEVNTTVTLDTGTVYIYLPEDTVESIADQYQGIVSEYGYVVIYCDSFSDSDYISFNFGSDADFHVSVNDLVIYRQESTSGDICYLALFEGDTSSYLLGQYFLQYVYSIYDWDAQKIGLAALNSNATSTANHQILNINSALRSVTSGQSVSATPTVSMSIAATSFGSSLVLTASASPSSTSVDGSSSSDSSEASGAASVGVSISAIVLCASTLISLLFA